MRSTGRLTAWDQVTGRGVATLENVAAPVFISKRALRAPLDSLRVGQVVEFSLGTNALGLVGSDVTLAAQQSAPSTSGAATASSSAGNSPGSESSPPRKKGRTASKPTGNATPHLDTVTAPPIDLEPHNETPAAGSSPAQASNATVSFDDRLAEHAQRRDDPDAALAAAFASTVSSFATSQLAHLRADHLSSHHAAGVVATDADEAGAARIDAMQRMVLSWKDEPARPTAADLKDAHCALVIDGGQTRQTGVRAGSTHFTIRPRDVLAKLEEFSAALCILTARSDLSAVAKAAWAGYQFLAIHPFADGNGRLARALINLFLARAGVPFVVGFAASDSQRATYRAALVASHRADDSRPFAAMVRTSILRGWAALSTQWASAKAPAVAAAGAVSQSHSASALRDEARSSNCMICLDEQPTCTLLCCGGAFHMRCLSRWINDSNRRSCPQCRAEVPADEQLGPGSSSGSGGGGVHVIYVPVDDTTVEEQEDDTTLDTTVEVDDPTVEEEEDDDTTVDVPDDRTVVSDQEDDDTTVVEVEDDTTIEVEEDDTTVEGSVEEDDTTAEDPDDENTAVDEEDDTTARVSSNEEEGGPGVDADDDTTAEADDDSEADDTLAEHADSDHEVEDTDDDTDEY